MGYGQGSPQLEDGFTQVANEILDAIARTSLTDYEARCIHYLWRKTYGWRNEGIAKKEDVIAYSQWAKGTDIDKRSVMRTLRSLEKRNIVTRRVIKREGKNPFTIWGFQKYYLKWNRYRPIQLELVSLEPPLTAEVVSAEPPLLPQVVSAQPPLRHEVVTSQRQSSVTSATRSGAPLDTKMFQQKKERNYTKDILPSSRKKTKTPDPYNDDVKAVFEALKTRRGIPSPNPGAEAVAIRWMLKQNFTVEQIIATYDKMKQEPFWSDKGLKMQTVKSHIADKLKPSSLKSKPGHVPTAAELDEMAKKKGVL